MGSDCLETPPHDFDKSAAYRAYRVRISKRYGHHIPAHVRDGRSRRLTDPVATDDFGDIALKGLPVLEKANQDVLRKLLQESAQRPNKKPTSVQSPGPGSAGPSLEGSPLISVPIRGDSPNNLEVLPNNFEVLLNNFEMLPYNLEVLPCNLEVLPCNLEVLPNPGRDDLWGLAYKQLLAENEPLVRNYEKVLKTAGNVSDDSAADIQKQVQAVLGLKRKQVLQKQWKLQWGNKSIKVRTQIDRIVKVIGAFKEAGSVATNVDPFHAGLPWAGICFLLAVSTLGTCLAIKH